MIKITFSEQNTVKSFISYRVVFEKKNKDWLIRLSSL